MHHLFELLAGNQGVILFLRFLLWWLFLGKQGGTKGWWDHTVSQASYPALTSILLTLQVATSGREGNQESVE
jgi:hypothetical protein